MLTCSSCCSACVSALLIFPSGWSPRVKPMKKRKQLRSPRPHIHVCVDMYMCLYII